jgi:DNA-binding CsgD family transcriptional regulator
VNKPSALSFEPHRVRRLLFCGVHDYRDLRMFQEAFAAADGDVDFVSLHTTDPEMVEDYRRRFSPDFVVLANEELPDAMPGIHRLRTVVQNTAPQPKAEGILANRSTLERPLTERQIAVLQYLRNGCTNRKIAEYMGVQPRTVKDWLKHLYLLFFVSNRTELVARAIDFGERPPAAE